MLYSDSLKVKNQALWVCLCWLLRTHLVSQLISEIIQEKNDQIELKLIKENNKKGGGE